MKATPLSYATPEAREQDRGHLLHNFILFGRVLRGIGMDVNTARMMDLMSALRFVDITVKADVKNTARCLLVHAPEDGPLFDQAFEMFWKKTPGEWRKVDLPALEITRRRKKPIVTAPPLQERPEPENNEDDNSADVQPPIVQVTQTYSAREILRHKDFSELGPDELDEVKAMMADFVWNLAKRRTRRYERGGGASTDFRKTLRKNLRYGAEILEWSWKTQKYKPRPLVVIADISGSMERYARLLVRFVYAISFAMNQKVEGFVFGTRLTRITRELQQKDIDVAMNDVGKAVLDWNGGTRIGESLRMFNFGWARRVLGHGAVVLLISDGWDRGEPELLSAEMQRLELNCSRLIWLNPLLGQADYEPLTRGMVAALPHVHDFLPVHNLASLEDLANKLKSL